MASDPDQAELEESRMPFLSHLRELRDRVRNAAIFFAAAFVACFAVADEIYAWLREPLYSVWRNLAKTNPALGEPRMAFGSLTEPFWVNMSVALWGGIFVASPFIFYQLWKFIAPGLYKRERKITIGFAAFSGVFFIGGALFCYYVVLERMIDFLLGYADPSTKPTLMLSSYLDLTRDMLLAFGAIFELPLLIFFLSMVGLTTHRGLWKFNRWFIVLAFVIGAILTPTPDVPTQLMMALPMIALYNASILVAWAITSRRERAEKELRERERLADEREAAGRSPGDRDDDDD